MAKIIHFETYYLCDQDPKRPCYGTSTCGDECIHTMNTYHAKNDETLKKARELTNLLEECVELGFKFETTEVYDGEFTVLMIEKENENG